MTRRRWVLAGVAVAVLWAVVAGLQLLGAAGDLRTGRDAARRARAALGPDAVAAGRPLPDLREATRRFASAHRATGGVLLLPARFVPVAGRQLRAVHALSGAAAEVADAATIGVDELRAALRRADEGGTDRLTQLRSLQVAVDEAAAKVRAVADLGPREGLLGPIAKAHNELLADVTTARVTLDDASAGIAAAVRLLAGPRRYLVVAANNAEMRAGSGMWLSGGVLTTNGGSFSLGEVGPLYLTADPPDGAVLIGDRDLSDRWGWARPHWDWRGLMTSPRLDAAGPLAQRMWSASGNRPVDGVLVLDPVGLAAVVAATGPVEVGGRTFGAADVVPYVLHGQYDGVGSDPADQVARREALAGLARSAFARLNDGDWSPSVLLQGLGAATRGRHLLAWAADPVEQRGWVAAGMAGTLSADSLAVSLENRAGNKLDWFTKVAATLATQPVGDDTQVSVSVVVRNDSPAGLSRYVGGPPPALRYASGTYRGILAVNVPGAARDVRAIVDGEPVVLGTDGPTQVIGVPVEVPRAGSIEVIVRFRLTGTSGSVRVEPSARVPGITWRHGGLTWEDNAPRTANWGVAHDQ